MVPFSSTLIFDALDGHFLIVPLSRRDAGIPVGRNHAVRGAMDLSRIEFAGIAGAVEHLQLAHARIGGIALARIANGQSVVAGRGQTELEPRHEIGVLVLR